MSYVLGAVVGLAIVVVVVRVSMRITNGKSTEYFKKVRPDASSIHGDGHGTS